MATEYGTLATLKRRLGIQADDTSQDEDLTGALKAASRSIERTCGRRFWLDPEPVTRTYRLAGRVVQEAGGDVLLVDDIGDTAGLVVAVGSGLTYTPITGYEPTPDNAIADGEAITGLQRLGSSWGTSNWDRVKVTARFGWPSVPDDITEATYLQAARLSRRKASPEGVMGSAEWGVVRVSRRDPDVWALIEPYILPGFA